MPKRTRSHDDAVREHLENPRAAAYYLNAALEESDEMFLLALRDVAEAWQMSRVAAEAGVSRESVYRMLCESGNPTYKSLTGILRALGLRIAVETDIALPTEGKESATTETVTFSAQQSTAVSIMSSNINHRLTVLSEVSVTAAANYRQPKLDPGDIFFVNRGTTTQGRVHGQS